MVDLVLCARPPICCYAKQKGMIVGARSTHRNQLSCCKPDFIDYDFKLNRWDRHLEVVKKLKPKYAVAPDIFSEDDLVRTIDKASKLLDWAENVIVVPHVPDLVAHIPDEFVIGYSVPTSYGAAQIGLWELRNRRVHLLGGSPWRQFMLAQYIPRVVSVDGNVYLRVAQYGKYWNAETGKWDASLKGKGIDMLELVRLSIDNVVRFWREERGE